MAQWPAISRYVVAAAVMAAGLSLSSAALRADEPVGSPTLLPIDDGTSDAYPDGTFGAQLSAASQAGDSAAGGPGYRPGPGRRDNWRVGPHWRVTADGVVLFRDGSNLDAILAQVEPIAPSVALPPLEFMDNFDHAVGGRVLATGEFPQLAGYELQIGYLGVEKWMANAYWEQETIPAASLPSSDIDVEQRRSLGYESSLHSVEINFQQMSRGYLKPYAGVRYLGFDESIVDRNHQFTTVILGDPDIGVVGDTLRSATAQQNEAAEIENNLIGFQGGLRLDMWRPTRRLHLSGFMSGGVYCNIVDRNRVSQDSTAITTKEVVDVDGTNEIQSTTNSLDVTTITSADGTRIAFVGEAALSATYRLNSSTALRGGYQVLFLGGVELAENLWTSPPPITAQSDELFLHGWFAGLEYRR